MEQKPILNLPYLVAMRGLSLASFGAGLVEGFRQASGSPVALDEIILVCGIPLLTTGVLRGAYFGLGLQGRLGSSIQKQITDQTNILPVGSAYRYVSSVSCAAGMVGSGILATCGYLIGTSVYVLSSK